MSPWLADLIVGLVAAVWATAFIVSLINPAYRIDPMVHTIFGAVAGGGMALRRKDPPAEKTVKPEETGS